MTKPPVKLAFEPSPSLRNLVTQRTGDALDGERIDGGGRARRWNVGEDGLLPATTLRLHVRHRHVAAGAFVLDRRLRRAGGP